MILNEVNMSPSFLKKNALTTDVRCGIEFEVITDIESTEEDEVDTDLWLHDLLNCSDASQVAEISTYPRNRYDLDDEYNIFVTSEVESEFDFDAFKEYAADYYDITDYESEEDMDADMVYDFSSKRGRIYRNAFADYVDHERDSFFVSFGEWISERIDDYDLQPNDTYINTITYDHDILGQVKDLFDDQFLGDTSEWRFEPDGSLPDGGVEIISPIINISDIEETITNFVKFARDNDITTNEKCGLHINLSTSDFDLKTLNYIKLAMLIGDKYILEKYSRAYNKYCVSAVDKISKIKLLPQLKAELGSIASSTNFEYFAELIASTNTATNIKAKYTSINVHNDRIEFRSPGGDWLKDNDTIQQVINTVYRFAYVLWLCKPENDKLYKNEYMKKLYKLMAEIDSDLTLGKIAASYACNAIDYSMAKQLLLKK